MEDPDQTYYIKRFYHPSQNRESENVEGLTGLSLEDAQAHCEATSVPGEFFDGYYPE